MSKDNDGKTKISGMKRGGLRKVVMAAALGFSAIGLGACSDNSNNDWNTEASAVPTDIDKMDASVKQADLVQGRESCINKLVEAGLTADEANTTCDDITEQAISQLPKEEQQNYRDHHHSSSGGTNFLLWYMLLNNGRTVHVYNDNPRTGNMNRLTRPTAGTNAPATLNKTQKTFLQAPRAQRASVAQTLAQRPGVQTTRPSGPKASSRSGFTSRGSMGGSSG
tara:strand:+ start:2583 stop:3251 length:669 start_codon:yes stop_codon:yes gene_type:complete